MKNYIKTWFRHLQEKCRQRGKRAFYAAAYGKSMPWLERQLAAWYHKKFVVPTMKRWHK